MLSSIHETLHSIDNPAVVHTKFDALKALRTPYRIDIPQPLYYVLEKFDDLYQILDHDIVALIEEAKALGDFAPLFADEPEEI